MEENLANNAISEQFMTNVVPTPTKENEKMPTNVGSTTTDSEEIDSDIESESSTTYTGEEYCDLDEDSMIIGQDPFFRRYIRPLMDNQFNMNYFFAVTATAISIGCLGLGGYLLFRKN